MSIYYSKKEKRYSVIVKGKKLISYSINSFGKYTEKLAQLADEYEIPFRNYFEIKNNYILIIIYSKKYGYHKVKIDNCDFDRVIRMRWCIKPDTNTYYCQSFIKGSRKTITLHRFILNYSGTDVIDHKNRNGLDNRRSNLRIVTSKINSRNTKNSDALTNRIYPNIYYIEQGSCKYYKVKVSTDNGVVTKNFNINKYKDDALKQAKKYVKLLKDSNGYMENRTTLHIRRK